MKLKVIFSVTTVGLCIASSTVWAHEGPTHTHSHAAESRIIPLPIAAERKGPVKVPRSTETAPQSSGLGFWKFKAMPELLPVPEQAKPHVKGAHGTVIVDSSTDTLYWGLQKVGWIAFKQGLTQSEIIHGDSALASGNLHGADLLQRPGQTPLVVAADDVENEVYLSDTSFTQVEKLGVPQNSPYTAKNQFRPTDVAFAEAGTLYVTDGYGKAFFMPAQTKPFKYDGVYMGGKPMSQTPHGITYIAKENTLLISARPEGQIKGVKNKGSQWLDTLALPEGSTVCDVDVWGDYALAPCLNGPGKSPGPIYIINLKTKQIVSIIKPKEELGFSEAQHIHDACWYIRKNGKKTEVYIVFTNWNPGGIGALKLVNPGS